VEKFKKVKEILKSEKKVTFAYISDISEVLKENKIINENLAKRLKEMSKFRNFLVHRYPFVQKEKLIEIAKHDLKMLKNL
jgi:uncharacterized protein YutE (UPF0331/DUF86 family)